MIWPVWFSEVWRTELRLHKDWCACKPPVRVHWVQSPKALSEMSLLDMPYKLSLEFKWVIGHWCLATIMHAYSTFSIYPAPHSKGHCSCIQGETAQTRLVRSQRGGQECTGWWDVCSSKTLRLNRHRQKSDDGERVPRTLLVPSCTPHPVPAFLEGCMC